MADIPKPSDEDNTKIRNYMGVGGVLTELLSTKEAKPLSKATDIKFMHNGEYRAYDDIKKPDGKPQALVDDNIKKISITTNGETRYFERIARIDQTRDKEVTQPNTGFKAMAWLETDKIGNALLANGKHQVMLTFPGYDGNPLEIFQTPQTKSMYAVGDGNLYPPVANVPNFISQVQAKLPNNTADFRCVGHSMGCATALAAATMLDAPLHLNEPVAATLAMRKLRDSLNDPTAALLTTQINMDTSVLQDRLNDVLKKTTSVRAYVDNDGEKLLTRSARMETWKDSSGVDKKAMQNKNVLHMNGASERFGVTDPDNEMIGNQQLLINMTGAKSVASGLAATFDPNHALPNIVKAANDNLSISYARIVNQEQPNVATTQNLDDAQQRSTFISSIHAEARKIDMDNNFTYSDTERQNFKTSLGDSFENQKEKWHTAHTKGLEAIASAQDKTKAMQENRGAGDLNGDGKVSEVEAKSVASWMAGKSNEERQKFASDLLAATNGKQYTYETASVTQAPATPSNGTARSK